jgi:hypothetical protein
MKLLLKMSFCIWSKNLKMNNKNYTHLIKNIKLIWQKISLCCNYRKEIKNDKKCILSVANHIKHFCNYFLRFKKSVCNCLTVQHSYYVGLQFKCQ